MMNKFYDINKLQASNTYHIYLAPRDHGKSTYMRKYNIKRELAYHEGEYAAIVEIQYEIDTLICESQVYNQNEKLWRLRDKVLDMYNLAHNNINELREELKDR